MILNGCALETNRDHSVFLRLHPSTAFQTLLLTMNGTPFLLRGFPPTVVLIRIVVGRGASGKKGMIKWMSGTDVVDFK